MRINTNMAALQAQTQMQRTSQALQRSFERLSSGQRVNSARDDASGLALGVGLESQARGLNRAILNMNETQGMLKTAEGALQTQMELAQRMRELAVQAANGILSSSDRANLDQELQSLLAEFNRVTRDANFNGTFLLDGSLGTPSIQVGAEKNQSIELEMGSSVASQVFRQTVGSGKFNQVSTLAVGGANDLLETGDFNEDGHLDLIVAHSGGLQILTGEGDGTFAPAKTLFTGSLSPTFGRLAVGDVTGDGHLDVVVSGRVLVGDGKGGFGQELNVGLAGNLALADLNEDGALDIISGQDENQSVALSDGAGGFFDPVTFFEAVAGSVYAGDFNNDGHQDVIISRGSSPQLSFFAGDGEGNLSFEAHSVLDAGINSSNIAMGDIDQDGDLDFIYGNADQVSLALNNGSGNFTVSATKYSIPEGSIGTSLKIELRLQDLNADGRVDIVARNRSAASVLLGQGGGGFSSAKTLADSFRTFALGDLNGDEIVDLVAFSDSSTLVFEAVVTTAAAADGVRIQTQAQAQKLLGILDYAIDKISEESFKLGKLSNRLDYAQSVTAQTRENLLAARSQIMDTDLAEETAELTRLQILQQAQASVLSQSNVSMQIALQLLSF